jgi:hypothetical protein
MRETARAGRTGMEQKIVVHLKSGRIHKGVTHDFEPTGGTFHVLPAEGGGVPVRISVEDMKALFWVKDYLGNRDFIARRRFAESTDSERRAIAVFEDGEEIWGTVGESTPDDRGFFFFPADRDDNNLRIFIVRSALRELRPVH